MAGVTTAEHWLEAACKALTQLGRMPVREGDERELHKRLAAALGRNAELEAAIRSTPRLDTLARRHRCRAA